jgi:hypothetical protein
VRTDRQSGGNGESRAKIPLERGRLPPSLKAGGPSVAGKESALHTGTILQNYRPARAKASRSFWPGGDRGRVKADGRNLVFALFHRETRTYSPRKLAQKPNDLRILRLVCLRLYRAQFAEEPLHFLV